jgi:hypothetical protein
MNQETNIANIPEQEESKKLLSPKGAIVFREHNRRKPV